MTTDGGIVQATIQTAEPQQLTATATVTATPTVQPSDPVAWLGAPTWRDTFSGTNNFYTTSDENITVLYARCLQHDRHERERLAFLEPGQPAHRQLLPRGDLQGRRLQQQRPLWAGLSRTQHQRGLFLRYPCSGKFDLTRWDTMNQLIEWKPAVPLKAGPNQTNRVGVMARGTELTLYINGDEVQKINNERYNEGLFGFFIASYGTYNFNVLVEEVAYWNQ